MTKEDHIIQLIGEVAEQGTQQLLVFKEGLEARIDRLETRVDHLEIKVDKLDQKVDRVETSLLGEMQNLHNENAKFFDEIIGFLRRAEQEREFMSVHLRRHDEEIRELQVAIGVC